MFATAFDRSRQIRDVAGILVYKDTNKQMELDKIVYPSKMIRPKHIQVDL